MELTQNNVLNVDRKPGSANPFGTTFINLQWTLSAMEENVEF